MKQDIAMNVTMKTNRNNITIKSKLYANYKNDDIDNYSYDCLKFCMVLSSSSPESDDRLPGFSSSGR